MIGSITKFRPDLAIGVIATEDGRTWRFRAPEILSAIEASELLGQDVDFAPAGRTASAIVVLSVSPWAALAGRTA